MGTKVLDSNEWQYPPRFVREVLNSHETWYHGLDKGLTQDRAMGEQATKWY